MQSAVVLHGLPVALLVHVPPVHRCDRQSSLEAHGTPAVPTQPAPEAPHAWLPVHATLGAPAGRAAHRPTELHAKHVVVHTDAQHTPPTQLGTLLPQSESCRQACPPSHIGHVPPPQST